MKGSSEGYSNSGTSSYRATKYKLLYSLSVNTNELSADQLDSTFVSDAKKAAASTGLKHTQCTGYTGSGGTDQQNCEAGNTLNNGYLYVYNSKRHTSSAQCGNGNCWCCRTMDDDMNYVKFFAKYGTHYVKKVHIGGSMSINSQGQTSAQSDSSESSMTASLNAGFEALGEEDDDGDGDGNSASLDAGIDNSQSRMKASGFIGYSASITCEGGSTSLCNNPKSGNLNKWIKSVEKDPVAVHGDLPSSLGLGKNSVEIGPITDLLSRSGGLTSHQRAAMLDEITSYLTAENQKCPLGPINPSYPGVATTSNTFRSYSVPTYTTSQQAPCGGKDRGYCNPDAAKCACKPGLTGPGCEFNQIGWGQPDDQGAAHQGAVQWMGESERPGHAYVCAGPGKITPGTEGGVNAAYSNKAGPWKGYQINGYCPNPTDMSAAQGLCVQGFWLDRWWNDRGNKYDNRNGFSVGGSFDAQTGKVGAAFAIRGTKHICSTGSGCYWGTQRCAHESIKWMNIGKVCGAKIVIMPGWSC
jgi:hypothetical protein